MQYIEFDGLGDSRCSNVIQKYSSIISLTQSIWMASSLELIIVMERLP